MPSKHKFVFIACFAALAALAAGAQAAPDREPAAEPRQLVQQPAERFDSSLQLGALGVHYEALLEQARELGVKPKTNALRNRAMTPQKLRRGARALREQLSAARSAQRQERQYEASAGSVAGVSLSTLNSIAACESGGDPTAVNAAGYYGKYQFDMGTWASVGGSGNPAEASEAEQDYRAALLYSRAGSSPWPVCGA